MTYFLELTDMFIPDLYMQVESQILLPMSPSLEHQHLLCNPLAPPGGENDICLHNMGHISHALHHQNGYTPCTKCSGYANEISFTYI